jgi:hypothetical protein
MPVVLEELRQHSSSSLSRVLRENIVPVPHKMLGATGQLQIKGTAAYSNTVAAAQSVFGSALGFYPIHMRTLYKLFEQMNLV